MRAGGTLALVFLLSFLGALAVRDAKRRRARAAP
jgi:hypothetical protein